MGRVSRDKMGGRVLVDRTASPVIGGGGASGTREREEGEELQW